MNIDLQCSNPAPVGQSGAPAFVIGRDAEGHWLAIETLGRSGGFFTSQEAARRYAEFETDRRAGAVRVSDEPIALRL